MKRLPVYSISDFERGAVSFYAHSFQDHVQEHSFVNVAHKHDFYLCVYFTKGSGIHEIDFAKYQIVPGSLFVLKPGQFHKWSVKAGTEGYVFFHSADFFDLYFISKKLKTFPFSKPGYSQNSFLIRKSSYNLMELLFEKIVNAYSSEQEWKTSVIPSIVDLIYNELQTEQQIKLSKTRSISYLEKTEKFQELIERNYLSIKSPSEYAALMNISERHLNKITKETLGKTVKDLIAETIIIQAKRKLMENLSISQVAEELGYTDISYFTRLFKKHSNMTPKDFRAQQFAAR